MSFKTKTCSKCDGVLDGTHRSYCKVCHAAYARDHRSTHPEYKETNRRWRERNPEQFKRIKRNSVLKREYGITIHDFESMLQRQGNVCAICSGELVPWPHLDHDHATGRVREILCHHCNLAIGNVMDSPERAEQIAAYLRRHSSEG